MENLESKFNRLANMIFDIKEPTEIAILLTSVSDLPVYTAIIASGSTLREDDATWTYINTLFIEEQK